MRIVLIMAALVLGGAWFLLVPVATPRAAASDGGGELLMAAENGETERLQSEIRSRGVDVDAEFSGVTLLARAGASGRVETVRALLAMGADVDATGSSGWTALMTAVMYRHYDVVETLLKAGASVEIASEEGVTAMDIARRSEDERLIALVAGPVH